MAADIQVPFEAPELSWAVAVTISPRLNERLLIVHVVAPAVITVEALNAPPIKSLMSVFDALANAIVPDMEVVPSTMGLVVIAGAAVVVTAWPPAAETQPYTGSD